jgi:hypothetical protein
MCYLDLNQAEKTENLPLNSLWRKSFAASALRLNLRSASKNQVAAIACSNVL